MQTRPTIVFVLLLVSATTGAERQRPNILLVMSDDHAITAIGAYGGRLAELNPSPTIDKLAEEGMLLENAFCGNAICTPSRASIMTGQYPHVNGITGFGGPLEHERQTLALEMKKAGYSTGIVGKWHLTARPSAFDYYKVMPKQGKYFDPSFFEGTFGDREGTEVRMQGHSSDCIADSVLDWFKTKRDKGKPFFMACQFKAPHDMFDNAPRYDSYLADVTIPEPDSLWDNGNNGSIATRGHNDELLDQIGSSVGKRNRYRNMAEKCARIFRKEGFSIEGLTDDEIKRNTYQLYLKKYLRCVKGVDDNLARIIDYLKREGLYHNTVVVYTSDQGFFLGEHDYQDKRWGYEEAMHMPFIVRYPTTIPAGIRSDAIVENIDFAATLLDFAGATTPASMQGRSFRSILETGREPKDWKQAAYYQYWGHLSSHWNPAHIAIRTKQYKLMMFYGARNTRAEAQVTTPPGWELYHLERDPREMNNLYDNPEYAGVVAELKHQFKTLRAAIGADSPDFRINAVIEDFWDYDEDDRARAIEISGKTASGEIYIGPEPESEGKAKEASEAEKARE